MKKIYLLPKFLLILFFCCIVLNTFSQNDSYSSNDIITVQANNMDMVSIGNDSKFHKKIDPDANYGITTPSPFVGVHGSASVFPSPATHVVNVLLGVQQDIVSVQLWGQSGLLLNETVVDSGSTAESIMISFDIEGLPPGIYFVKVNYSNHCKTIPFIIS